MILVVRPLLLLAKLLILSSRKNISKISIKIIVKDYNGKNVKAKISLDETLEIFNKKKSKKFCE